MHQNTNFYFLLILLMMPLYLEASPQCKRWIAKVASIQGQVDTQHSDEADWQSAHEDDVFCAGDKVRTSKWSRSTLILSNKSVVTLDQNTTLIFPEAEESPENSANWFLNLIEGSSFFRSRETQRLNIQTPFINAVHEGTEFLVAVTRKKTEISVFDGQVSAENSAGRIKINKGFKGIAEAGRPPQVQALKITPEDAVQWTLYYPPIVDSSASSVSLIADSRFNAALVAYRQGDVYQALTKLDGVPVDQQNTRYLTLKAALLLTVGRLDEAQLLIHQTQISEPNNSDAFALQAIIAVVKNQQQTALDLANQAVKANPDSAVAKIAQSYAYQAHFNIDEASKATKEATRLAPENALAWARLSELQLSQGDHDAALISAQKAQALNPKVVRTQTILGFADLAQTKIEAATKAFAQALIIDSSDPLARLGLGLAKIRKGNLEEGKAELETAVNLDPNNAVIRSYLGKAYYELRNKDYAGTEFKIAKEMDPKDPTPWFYDAILKQTTNRPVEALHDMQKAIELNDNRGVYRSKLFLDEDAAARTANMARIYNDLGFGRVALKEAWKSLGYDSTNPSAHRFLSDAYIGQPRYRIARASELLQAQLLQPINITPVQPQLTGENIGILNSTGPGSLSVNEYDPLFNSNGAHVVLNGAYGSNNTKTDNAIISGLYDRLSLSLGQFHFQTDGFRQNDDYKQDIYDAFAQYAVNPDLNIQVEFKSEDVRSGDVPLRLNGFQQENLRQTIEHDTARIGGHYKINTQQDLIVSAFYSTLKDSQRNSRPSPNFPRLISINDSIISDESGYQTEMQYVFHPKLFDITAGLGYLSLKKDVTNESISKRTTPPFAVLPTLTRRSISQLDTDYANGYVYSKQHIYPDLTTVLGFSYDSFDNGLIDRQQFNPKFGIISNSIKGLTLRSGIFRTLTRPLAANQTIEPTQVAGFNQFFDGNNGTTAWQYAIGLDYTPIKPLFVGGEIIWRNATQPITSNGSFKYQDRNETSSVAYFYWAPAVWTSLRTEYRYDQFIRDFTNGSIDPINPRSVATHQVPLSINLFHPSGLFAKATGTYVNQQVTSVRSVAGLDYKSEDFWTFDTSLGYRLPKRIGSVSFEVRNLFDNKFNYQSVFDASGPQLSHFIPERQLFVKLSLFY
jgi:Flp pilus assembly protein TadD